MNITCYDIDGNLLKTLTQWDINQKIVINSLSLTNTPEVHFCNPHSELALVGESTYSDGTLTTEVPNILLQENLPIIVYIYVPKGDGSAKTTYSIRIPVNPRPKPADYVYSDNAHFITYEELQSALANSIEVIELATSAAKHAEQAAQTAEAYVTVQGDLNENDPESPAYIKNRTHWKEEVERDYTVLPNIEPDPNLNMVKYGKKIGLEIGKEYTIDVYFSTGEMVSVQMTASEFPPEDIGLEGVPCLQQDYALLVDGVDFDLDTELPYIADNALYIIENHNVEKIVIQGIPSIEIIIHKIPSEYLDVVIEDEFNPESTNAQSGIAVDEAILEYDRDLVVTTKKLENLSVTTEKIADNSVTGSKIKSDSIENDHIVNDSIKANKLFGNIPVHKISIVKQSLLLAPSEPVNILSANYNKFKQGSWSELLINGRLQFTCAGEQVVYVGLGPNASVRTQLIDIPVNIPEAGVDYNFYCYIKYMRTDPSSVYKVEASIYTLNSLDYPNIIVAEKNLPIHNPTSHSGGGVSIYVKNSDNTAQFGCTISGGNHGTSIYCWVQNELKGLIL